MPRLQNDSPQIAAWSARTGEGSSTWDVCNPCFRRYLNRELPTILRPYKTGEMKGFAYECDDKPDSVTGEGYRCECCNKVLTDENYFSED